MTLQITINQTIKPKKRLHSHDQLPAHLPYPYRCGRVLKEYVKERHPGILSFDYAVWRLTRAISEFGISMREAISRISAKDLKRMMEEVEDDELQEDPEA